MDREHDDIAQWLPGQTLADRYRVLREVGQGAMGRVFEAQHVLLGKRLAVKVLAAAVAEPRARERFFHEARAASAIDHEHIVSVLDFGLIPETGQPYLVMEFVDGESLEDIIQRDAPLPLEATLEIAAQLLSALAVVHGAGLIHRDIKPANIIRLRGSRSRPFIKLLDFGVAGVLDHQAWGRRPLTRVRQVVGTPAYLAPEQARGEEVSAQWDLWAASIVLYEMLCGELPFPLETLRQIQEDIAYHRLTPLRERCPELPGWLLTIMDRALARQSSERFASATAYLQALELRAAPLSEHDERTTPFLRVHLATPPIELLRGGPRPEGTGPQRPPGPGSEDVTRGSPRATPGSLRSRSAATEDVSTDDADDADDAWQPPTAPTVAAVRPRRPSGSVSLAEAVQAAADEDEDATRAMPRVSLGELGPVPMHAPQPLATEPAVDSARMPLARAPELELQAPPEPVEDLRTRAVRRTDALELRSGEIPLRSVSGKRQTRTTTRPWVMLLLGGLVLLASAVTVAVLLAW